MSVGTWPYLMACGFTLLMAREGEDAQRRDAFTRGGWCVILCAAWGMMVI